MPHEMHKTLTYKILSNVAKTATVWNKDLKWLVAFDLKYKFEKRDARSFKNDLKEALEKEKEVPDSIKKLLWKSETLTKDELKTLSIY